MSRVQSVLRKLSAPMRRFGSERRGNVAMIAALAAPVLIGSFGLGSEVTSWYANQHAMQNAADSSAIAAATNATSNYGTEAKAVAAHYGFTDGKDGVVVTTSDTATCPDGTNACYSVSISRPYPLILTQFVGYSGDATVNGAPAKKLLANAIATQSTVQRPYCLVALGQNGTTIRTNGAPNANFSGCNILANGGATCNGHDLQADVGDAHGTNSGCGKKEDSGVPILKDPYSSLASNIPPETSCGGVYPPEPAKKNGTPLPLSNQLNGTYLNIPRKCGDVQLTGDVTITQDTTLVIYNGNLDLNSYTLRTAPGASLTIVFSGDNSSPNGHAPIGSGTLDFAAPKSGDWSGVAIYQDPSLSQGPGVNISAAGNSPTWDVTGLVYLPHSSVTFSGAVNKSSNGDSCFALVVDNVTINGTGSILAHGDCAKAGLILPTNPVPGRGKLVS